MDLVQLAFRADTTDLDKAERKLDAVGKRAEQAQQKARGFSSAFEGARSLGGPLGDVADRLDEMRERAQGALTAVRGLAGGAAGAAVAIAALAGAAGVLAALRFAGALDDIGDLAEKLGLSATQAALLDQQLKSAGTNIDTYYNGLQRVATVLSKADGESKKSAESLKTLGISARESNDPLSVLNELTTKYGERLRDGKVNTEEMAALQSVLGKNYRELIVASEQVAVAKERENAFFAAGVGISQDGIAAASDYERAQNDIAFVLQSVGSTLVSKVVPAFTTLINQLLDSYKNGGLVKAVFEGITFAANAVMVPIRALINIFIALDTVITSVGKGIGAVFAALATRSVEPLKALKSDIAALLDEADKKVRANALWGSDSGTIAPPKPIKITGSTGTPSADTTNTRSPKESDANRALVDQERGLARLRAEYQQLFGVQTQSNAAMVEAEIAAGRYNLKLDEQELASLRQKAADQDRLAELIKREQAEKRAWEESDRAVAAEQNRVTAMRQSNAENRIALDVMSRYGTTQDDLNIAISDYNIAQAQTALAIAQARGATEQELEVLKQKLAALREMRDLQVERKDDNDAAAAKQQTFGAGWKNAFDQYTKDAQNAAKIGEDVFGSMTSNMEGALNKFVMTGKFSFKDFTKSILADIAQIMAKQAMLWAVKSMMGFSEGGAFNGGAQFFAKGGAFTKGVQMFASGGVVSSPTAFGMSGGKLGVMGEAGPEAIMPLKRGADGKLGVVASGGASSNTNVVNNYSVVVEIGSVDSQERQDTLLKAIDDKIKSISKQTMANEMRPGGMLHRKQR